MGNESNNDSFPDVMPSWHDTGEFKYGLKTHKNPITNFMKKCCYTLMPLLKRIIVNSPDFNSLSALTFVKTTNLYLTPGWWF